MSKTYIGISRDHSGSMQGIAKAAARDYNTTIAGISAEATVHGEDTIVSVVKCGSGRRGLVERVVVNSSIQALKPLNENQYDTDGSQTPLFDSVLDLISILETAPDRNDPGVSFVVTVITDGAENGSTHNAAFRLKQKIVELQRTDRWTFSFRVPRGYSRTLASFGIPQGNILEWDQTEQGVQESTNATRSGFSQYFADKKLGKTSTDRFYTNVADIDIKTIQSKLRDISAEVSFWIVKNDAEGASIRDFCQLKSGKPMLRGAAFYQLIKPEREVQATKQIAIRDKKTGAIYSGAAARDMIGLPHSGTHPVSPGDHGTYEIYIQSTSINRRLPVGTTVLYWSNVGVAYKEGASAPAQPVKAPVVAPHVQPHVTPAVASSVHSSGFIAGYKIGFEDGKNKAAQTVWVKSPDGAAGYALGHKHGRGKQKRLYK